MTRWGGGVVDDNVDGFVVWSLGGGLTPIVLLPQRGKMSGNTPRNPHFQFLSHNWVKKHWDRWFLRQHRPCRSVCVLVSGRGECVGDVSWNQTDDDLQEASSLCAVMPIANLKYLHCLPVPCDLPIKADVICTKQSFFERESSADKNLTGSYICSREDFFFRNSCYSVGVLQPKKFDKRDKDLMDFMRMIGASTLTVSPYDFVLAVPARKKYPIEFFQYDKLSNRYILLSRDIKDGEAVFYVTKGHLSDIPGFNMLLLKCGSGEFISRKLVHNNMSDCGDGEDEALLFCTVKEKPMDYFFCKNLCQRPWCKCPPLYHHKLQGGCFPFSESCMDMNCDLNFVHPRRESSWYSSLQSSILMTVKATVEPAQAEKSANIDQKKRSLSIFYTDCTVEELQDIRIDVRRAKVKCVRRDELPCTYGCAKCFPVHKLCVYEMDSNGNLMHCPSGAHLKDCFRMHCNNMYKCREYYCIPYRLVFWIHNNT